MQRCLTEVEAAHGRVYAVTYYGGDHFQTCGDNPSGPQQPNGGCSALPCSPEPHGCSFCSSQTACETQQATAQQWSCSFYGDYRDSTQTMSTVYQTGDSSGPQINANLCSETGYSVACLLTQSPRYHAWLRKPESYSWTQDGVLSGEASGWSVFG